MASEMKRLKDVVAYAQSKEREAARSLAAVMQKRSMEEERLAELTTYLQEYTNIAAPEALAVPVTQIRNNRVFIGQLQHALSHQEDRLETIADHVSRHIQCWQKAKADLRRLDKLMERYRHREQKAMERAGQVEMDEMARHCKGIQLA